MLLLKTNGNIFYAFSIVNIYLTYIFSAENGDLYMWGKNSHVILPNQPPSHRIWNPVCVNQRTKPVKTLFCGSWHAVALTGFPGRAFYNYFRNDSKSIDKVINSFKIETIHSI